MRSDSAGAMNRRGPPVIKPRPTPMRLNRTGSVRIVHPADAQQHRRVADPAGGEIVIVPVR